jgi:hypothetical protein
MASKKQKIFASTVVAVIILAAMTVVVLPSLTDRNNPILMTGDYLEYNITGSQNNVTLSGWANATISSNEDSGIHCSMLDIWGWGSISSHSSEFMNAYSDESRSGEWIGNEEISTAFGTKCVKMYFFSDENDVVLYDVGLDSSIVYRWTVVSYSGAYYCTYELANTNNSQIFIADTTIETANIMGHYTPSSVVCETLLIGFCLPGEGSVCGQNSVKVSEGQQFHYVIGGNGTAMYVFNFADFIQLDNAGRFQCNASLSRLPGNPGETNATVDPGIYWYIFVYRGTEHPVYYDGEQYGGQFIRYFG